MTNPACQNRNRAGDCLKRNLPSDRLCDVCFDLLSDSEMRERDISLLAAKMRRKANGAEPGCTHRLKTKTDHRTCTQKKLLGLCPGCISAMSDQRLIKYCAGLYDEQQSRSLYWQEQEEAEEYAAELKARGMTGVDWNIEADFGDPMERAQLIYSLFLFSMPCFWRAQKEAA